MKKTLLLFFLLTLFAGNAFALNCDNPCGAEELIGCAAQNAGITAEEYFNTKLFNTANLDGFCKNPPSGWVSTGQQKFMYDNYCKNVGGFYTYGNFIAASKNFPEFGCAPNTDKNTRYKELAMHLASIALETTSVAYNYTNDGLYNRYEASHLTGNSVSDKTVYYPPDAYKVGQSASSQTYTPSYWSGDASGALNYHLNGSTVNITWDNSISLPSGYTLTQLNQIVDPVYWVGMGPTQLTGNAMMSYFGWYNSNLAANKPVNAANFKDFVASNLTDGQVAFNGSFWYWMSNVTGIAYPTLHGMINNTVRPVCKDIAAVTIYINGGCNNYNPGRLNYYRYFLNDLFGIQPVSVTENVTYQGATYTLDSLDCPPFDINNPTSPSSLKFKAFQNYCQQQ